MRADVVSILDGHGSRNWFRDNDGTVPLTASCRVGTVARRSGAWCASVGTNKDEGPPKRHTWRTPVEEYDKVGGNEEGNERITPRNTFPDIDLFHRGSCEEVSVGEAVEIEAGDLPRCESDGGWKRKSDRRLERRVRSRLMAWPGLRMTRYRRIRSLRERTGPRRCQRYKPRNPTPSS